METNVSNTRGEMTKERAIQILNSRKFVTTEHQGSNIQVKVVSEPQAWTREDGTPVHICNFNGMTPYHKDEALKMIKEGDFQGAVNQQLSSGQRDGIDFIPKRGEIVNITVEEQTTSNDITGLFVTSVSPLPAAKTSKVDFTAMLEGKSSVEAPKEEDVVEKEK